MIPIANPKMTDAERDTVLDVLDSGMLADGPEVRKFEDEFAAYCDCEHGVATSNGTTALHAAFEALGIGAGDRVITTTFSFIASANAIQHAGAKPVFVDIDPDTYNLDPHAVEETIRAFDGEIDAILAVHLYGLPADMPALEAIASKYDIPIVEDAAQAHGATVDGSRVGSIGDIGCFSFYPTKNMTTGEGGMITTDDEELAARAARFVNHGRSGSYEHVEVGHNFRMTSIAAAIGRVQLEKLPAYIEKRRSNADRLTRGLADLPVLSPTEPEGRRHVYHQYTVRVDNRTEFCDYLEARDVGTGVYYPKCIHNQPAYSGYDSTHPVAEQAADEVVSLPVHPTLTERDAETIIEMIERYATNAMEAK